MFDVDVGGVAYRESEHEEPGAEIVTAELGGALEGPRADRLLRPALPGALPDPRRARGAGDHRPLRLHPADRQGPLGGLLRARAIENQVFVVAPNQVGEAPPAVPTPTGARRSSTHGACPGQAPDEECFVAADLDFAAQDSVRATLPALANRRPGAYQVAGGGPV